MSHCLGCCLKSHCSHISVVQQYIRRFLHLNLPMTRSYLRYLASLEGCILGRDYMLRGLRPTPFASHLLYYSFISFFPNSSASNVCMLPYTDNNSFYSFVPPVPTATYSKTLALRVEFVVELLIMTQWKVYQYAGGRRWTSPSSKTQRRTRRTMMARMAPTRIGRGLIYLCRRTSTCCLPIAK